MATINSQKHPVSQPSPEREYDKKINTPRETLFPLYNSNIRDLFNFTTSAKLTSKVSINHFYWYTFTVKSTKPDPSMLMMVPHL